MSLWNDTKGQGKALSCSCSLHTCTCDCTLFRHRTLSCYLFQVCGCRRRLQCTRGGWSTALGKHVCFRERKREAAASPSPHLAFSEQAKNILLQIVSAKMPLSCRLVLRHIVLLALEELQSLSAEQLWSCSTSKYLKILENLPQIITGHWFRFKWIFRLQSKEGSLLLNQHWGSVNTS